MCIYYYLNSNNDASIPAKNTFKLDMFLGDKFTQNEKVVIIYSP